MPRIVRAARIDSRTARSRLPPNREPTWSKISRGCYLGYRKGVQGGSWVARWRDPEGRQKYTTLGIADDTLAADGLNALSFEQAQIKARAWFEDIASRTILGRAAGPYTVAQCMADYIAYLKKYKKSARHVRSYAEAYILPHLGALDVETLTAERIDAWHTMIQDTPPRARTGKGKSQAYRAADPDPLEADRKAKRRANTYLVYLHAALNRALKAEKTGRNPKHWMSVKTFKEVDKARTNYLSESQAQFLANTSPPDLRDLIQLALVTGARYSELCAFNVGDFDASNGSLLVRTSKSGEKRHIILSEEGCRLCELLSVGRPLNQPLLRRANGERWQRDLHYRPFKQACVRAGLGSAFTFHELRHTWASLAVMNGAELIVIAKNLGHRDTRMVERVYGHLAEHYVARRIRKTAPTFGFDLTGGAPVRLHPHIAA